MKQFQPETFCKFSMTASTTDTYFFTWKLLKYLKPKF